MIARLGPAAAAAVAIRVPRPAATAASVTASVSHGSQPSGRQARNARCFAASTEQGHERRTGSSWAGSSTNGDGWSSGGAHASSADPLLRSIAQCSTSRELHQLLLRHSGELGGREVAAAIEVTARRRLLEPAPTSGGSGSRPLAPLLVQLADKYAPVMEPASLSAAAWGLAAMQLSPARPVMRQMHDLARRQLFRFAPSQLCTLLWAGSTLEPGAHSPLLPALTTLVRGGMSLALFSSHDLAALAYLCAQDGGPARDILVAVTDECRSRLQEYQRAEKQVRGGAAAPRKRQPRVRPAAGGVVPALPPPPFTPADAAMLLTGLARQRLRVGGLVEPLVQQCEPQLEEASANDVVRILVALGDLLMEIETESLSVLLGRVCEVQADLSPQQVAATLWACSRIGASNKHLGGKLASVALRHYTRRASAYRAVDTIGVLWGAAQMRRAPSDEALVGALRAVRPELGRQSTGGLTSLLGALGKHAELRSAARSGWLEGPPAGQEAVGMASAVLAELARRVRHMQPAELSAAAAALATNVHLAAALQPPAQEHAVVLRSACAAVAAANELLAFDVAQLATAAAKLRWTDRGFVDALAHAINSRIRFGLTTSEVFSQALCALVSLAPSSYGDLFNALAASYASKTHHLERLPAYLSGQAEERTVVLSAFAAVARGLHADVIQDILASVSAVELRTLPPADAAPLLVLAAQARVPHEAPVVQACCRTIRRSFPRLGRDALRQAHAALLRMCPPRDPLLLMLERHLYAAPQADEGKQDGELGSRG